MAAFESPEVEQVLNININLINPATILVTCGYKMVLRIVQVLYKF